LVVKKSEGERRMTHSFVEPGSRNGEHLRFSGVRQVSALQPQQQR